MLGCQKPFPCPNRTRDWPCRNWLDDPCLCLRANPFQIVSSSLYRVLPKRKPLQKWRDGVNRKERNLPPQISICFLYSISVSRTAPTRPVWADIFASMIQFLHDLFPPCMDLCQLKPVPPHRIQPQFLFCLGRGFWVPAAVI